MTANMPASHTADSFTSAKKVEAVLRLLKGESVDAVSEDVGVSGHRLERWRRNFLAGGAAELSPKPSHAPQNWVTRRSGAIMRWTGLLLALAVSIALLALLLQRPV
jgi:transposase